MTISTNNVITNGELEQLLANKITSQVQNTSSSSKVSWFRDHQVDTKVVIQFTEGTNGKNPYNRTYNACLDIAVKQNQISWPSSWSQNNITTELDKIRTRVSAGSPVTAKSIIETIAAFGTLCRSSFYYTDFRKISNNATESIKVFNPTLSPAPISSFYNRLSKYTGENITDAEIDEIVNMMFHRVHTTGLVFDKGLRR